MPLIRKILFWIFTAVYAVLCPLLILYSLGYAYSPIRGEWARTGVLKLSTLPHGAEIFLEKSRFTHQTPAAIEELLPGDYTITLRKKGYKVWTQRVSIEAGKATAYEKIVLIPDS